jgi:hemophore-related protein
MTRQPINEGAIMLPSARPARCAVMGAIGAGALAGAMLFGAAATAAAQPAPPPFPPPPPPVPVAVPVQPCTAAELARVMSGVSFDTSNYLAMHPDVNNFFTSLKGRPHEEIRAQVQTYLDANPQIRSELQRIRQPSADFRQRCGVPETP